MNKLVRITAIIVTSMLFGCGPDEELPEFAALEGGSCPEGYRLIDAPRYNKDKDCLHKHEPVGCTTNEWTLNLTQCAVRKSDGEVFYYGAVSDVDLSRWDKCDERAGNFGSKVALAMWCSEKD